MTDTTERHDPTGYSRAVPINAEGARVGFVHCIRCGAAVLLDVQEYSLAIHDRWHERFEP